MNYLFSVIGVQNKNTPNYILKYKDLVYTKLKPLGFVRWHYLEEIPIWIPRIMNPITKSATLSDKIGICIINTPIDEGIIKDVLDAIKPDYVFTFRLPSNTDFIDDFTRVVKSFDDNIKVIVCGHNKPDYSIQDLCDELHIKNVLGYNYSIFKTNECIPRLQLSVGCDFDCEFCVTDRNIIIRDYKDIKSDIDTMTELKFKLVRVDDNTFGQNANYKLLGLSYDDIKEFNNNFNGFIIRTSPVLAKNDYFCKELHNLGIKIVELGIESGDEEELKHFKKPFSTSDSIDAINNLNKLGLYVVANIIVNSPFQTEEAFNNTLAFIENNKNNILYYNIHNYSDYKKLHTIDNDNTKFDTDEDTYKCSWLDDSVSAARLYKIYDFATSELENLKL